MIYQNLKLNILLLVIYSIIYNYIRIVLTFVALLNYPMNSTSYTTHTRFINVLISYKINITILPIQTYYTL